MGDVKPDMQMMLAHLRHLFGGELGAFSNGLIEIAWTTMATPGGTHKLNRAMLFGVDQMEAAAGHAYLMNSRGSNVYVAPALRKPGTFPGSRASDSDVLCMLTMYVDLDAPGRAENAHNVWDDDAPSLVVMTGLIPHARMHANWRLAEPLTDLARGTRLLRAMADAFDGDVTVVNPSRVMRLAGSIAYPTKELRVLELAHIHQLKRTGQPTTPIETLEDKFSQFFKSAGLTEPLPIGAPVPNPSPTKRTSELPMTSQGTRFDIGPMDDGRERYMRDTVLAGIKQFAGQHGCAPTPHELYELTWPQYERNVDLSRPGRGPDEFLEKCTYTVDRFNRGLISSMPSLDAAITAYKANGAGHAAAAPAHEQATPTVRQLINATPFVYRHPKSIPHRQFLYGTHYIRQFASSTIAPGGSGKSTLVLAEALAMVTGKPLLGVQPEHKLRVWLWNGEDPREETERRIAAACLHYGIEPDELGGLFMDSGRDAEIIMAVTTKGGTEIAMPVAENLIAEIRRHKIDVMIIDPFVSSHRVSENDNMAIDAVVKAWARIADATGCAIELVHHSRKTNGNEVSVEDARGASALTAATRSARVINTMTKEEAAKAGVKNHRLYLRLENGKANLAPPAEHADWYQLVSVPLGNSDGGVVDNGDKVAVVVPWQWPDMLEGVTGTHAEAARDIIRKGKYRANQQSPDWVGLAVAKVMGLDPDDKHDKAVIVHALKTWEASGMIRTVMRPDEARKPRPFVEVVDDA